MREGDVIIRCSARKNNFFSVVGVFVLLFMILLNFLPDSAEGAGKILPEDFAYKNLFLGDHESVMRQKLGEPLYDKRRNVMGIDMICYQYPDDVTVGVFAHRRTVAEIAGGDEKYAARDGVRYGATIYKIISVFGRTEKRLIGGDVCYVYTNPQNLRQRLILTTNLERGDLKSWRLTQLPLDETEAAAWGKEIADAEMIDLSALPPTVPVKLRRVP